MEQNDAPSQIYSIGDVVYSVNGEEKVFLIGTILDIIKEGVDYKYLLRLFARWDNIPQKAQEDIIYCRYKSINQVVDADCFNEIRYQLKNSRELFYTYLEITVPFADLRGKCSVINLTPKTFHLLERGLADDEFVCCRVYRHCSGKFEYFQSYIKIGCPFQALISSNTEFEAKSQDRELNSSVGMEQLIYSPKKLSFDEVDRLWKKFRNSLISVVIRNELSRKRGRTRGASKFAQSISEIINEASEDGGKQQSTTAVGNRRSKMSEASKTKPSVNSEKCNIDETNEEVALDEKETQISEAASKFVDSMQEYFLGLLFSCEFSVENSMKKVEEPTFNIDRLKKLLIESKRNPDEILFPKKKNNKNFTNGSNGNGKKESVPDKVDQDFDELDSSSSFIQNKFQEMFAINSKFNIKLLTDEENCFVFKSNSNQGVKKSCFVNRLFSQFRLNVGNQSSNNSVCEEEKTKSLCGSCYTNFRKYAYLPNPSFDLCHRFVLLESAIGYHEFIAVIISIVSFAVQRWDDVLLPASQRTENIFCNNSEKRRNLQSQQNLRTVGRTSSIPDFDSAEKVFQSKPRKKRRQADSNNSPRYQFSQKDEEDELEGNRKYYKTRSSNESKNKQIGNSSPSQVTRRNNNEKKQKEVSEHYSDEVSSVKKLKTAAFPGNYSANDSVKMEEINHSDFDFSSRIHEPGKSCHRKKSDDENSQDDTTKESRMLSDNKHQFVSNYHFDSRMNSWRNPDKNASFDTYPDSSVPPPNNFRYGESYYHPRISPDITLPSGGLCYQPSSYHQPYHSRDFPGYGEGSSKPANYSQFSSSEYRNQNMSSHPSSSHHHAGVEVGESPPCEADAPFYNNTQFSNHQSSYSHPDMYPEYSASNNFGRKQHGNGPNYSKKFHHQLVYRNHPSHFRFDSFSQSAPSSNNDQRGNHWSFPSCSLCSEFRYLMQAFSMNISSPNAYY